MPRYIGVDVMAIEPKSCSLDTTESYASTSCDEVGVNREHGGVPVTGVRYPVAALIEAPDLADGGGVDSPPDDITVGKHPHLPAPPERQSEC